MASELELPLPRSAVLKNKNNGKYLRYTDEDTEQHGLLQFTGEATVPTSRFELEPSQTLPGLVHIRCVYNNRYWARATPDDYWIGASAGAIEEDQSKWTCTLFKPVPAEDVDEDGGGDALFVRFLHVQSNHYASLFPGGDFLYAGTETVDPGFMDVCQVVDWESLLVLPQRVVFKGDNGKYLRVEPDKDFEWVLDFSATDIGDPSVGFQVFPTPEGAIQIKETSTGNNLFWCNVPFDLNMIQLSSESDPLGTVFWPVKVDDNIVAFRCQGNNKFGRRQDVLGRPDTFAASVSTISQEARIQVEEQVISRQIYNVRFRLLDARIYDQTVVVATTGQTSNGGPSPVTNKVTLTHTETTTKTWQGNVGLKVGVKTTIVTGIPVIAEGKIEISAEVSGSYTWGETNTKTDTVTNEYDTPVSPRSIAYVSLLETKGKCDVPFSYTASDVLYDGRRVTYERDDGIYTGLNSYNYQYETREEPIPPPTSSSKPPT